MSNDPLLQPYKLKHLTLRNRIIVTSHEPAYPDDGMPKERYRAYTVERAKGGVAMTMTAGSAAVSRDSPPVFNNLLAYKDEIVPWIRDMTDAVHEQGAAIMIQLTHLGRRTRWDKGDWLPVLAPSHQREAAHRAFPKKLEDWDIERIIKDFADAAERMKAGGMDGVELEAYGHLIDQFASPLTNELDGPYGGSLENRMRFCFDVFRAMRERVGDDFILGVRYTADECLPGGTDRNDGIEISKCPIGMHEMRVTKIVPWLEQDLWLGPRTPRLSRCPVVDAAGRVAVVEHDPAPDEFVPADRQLTHARLVEQRDGVRLIR